MKNLHSLKSKVSRKIFPEEQGALGAPILSPLPVLHASALWGLQSARVSSHHLNDFASLSNTALLVSASPVCLSISPNPFCSAAEEGTGPHTAQAGKHSATWLQGSPTRVSGCSGALASCPSCLIPGFNFFKNMFQGFLQLKF